MEENEKLSRTNSNQPTKNTSEDIGISEGQTAKRAMPGQRTVRRRAAGDQASVGRLSDIQGARRRTTGSAGTTAKRRRPEGNKVSAERRRPEEGGSSVERRRPEGSEVPVRRRQRRSSDGGRQARRKQNRRRRKRNLKSII